jgi:DNA-binding CsgD family transcriptional regulator
MKTNNPSVLGSLLSGILDNPKLKKKLVQYADKLLFIKTKKIFARHLTPEDILFNVTCKFLIGDIIWNQGKSSLLDFLFLRIRSEVSNLVKKEKKFLPVPLEKLEDIEEDLDGNEIELPVPEELIINPFEDELEEAKVDPMKFKKLAYELFKDSPEEFCVLDEMYKGHQPRHIASTLGITENEVYNIKKRIVRVLKTIPRTYTSIIEPIIKVKLKGFPEPQTFGKN